LYYLTVLRNEITNTKTYNLATSSEVDILDSHVKECTKFNINLNDKFKKLPTLYWIPKLHKTPYKSRFIANSTSCTTKVISILLTSCLTIIKLHWKLYSFKVYENSGINLFWSIKNSGEFLSKLENKNFRASSISTYDFSTLYTTLPHHLIKSKLISLINRTFSRENKLFLACNQSKAFFTNDKYDGYHMWTNMDVCQALVFLLDNIFVKFGHKIYRQVIGIPMGTNCAPLVADLFLFCYEMDFMLSLDRNSQVDVIHAFNDTSRYLDDICNIDNAFFPTLVQDIYPQELELVKANISDTIASFLDLKLVIDNDVVSTSVYDKRDDFNFSIVNYPHLSGDIPQCTSYGVYISQLIRIARCCSNVTDFNNRNLLLTSKLLKQGYRFHKLCKSFKKFYKRSQELLTKYNCSLKTYLINGISHPLYYGDVVYSLRRIKGHSLFKTKFVKIINRFLNRGYKPNVLKYSAEMVLEHDIIKRVSYLF
tara:strand:- start:330 stop:1772 length:1443 start_codon:yes stop_codon:yes gene_type:complete